MSIVIIVILMCILLSAFFSGMEIAFLSSNKLMLELDKKEKSSTTAYILNVFTKHSSEYISTMLVGNNVMLVIYGMAVARLLDDFLMQIVENSALVIPIETIISTFVILITAEFLPKALFRINPNFFLKTLAVPAYFFYIILFPVNKIAIGLSSAILRIFGVRIGKKKEQAIFDKSDLLYLSDEIVNQNEENEMEHDIRIFQNALEFPEVKVRECMVPRTEIEAIDEHESIDELRRIFIESGYSRIPVYRDTPDNMIGYINSKDLIKGMEDIEQMLRPVDFVPETMSAQKLLATFTRNKKSIAVVVDEFGGTAGLVTIEDIMEEIFGDIEDEHDSDRLVDKKISDTEYILSGRLEVDYLNEEYELDIPESDEYETLAGYIISQNERIPLRHEELGFNNFRIKIIKATATRIDLIKLQVINP